MCNFVSAIVLKNGDIICDPEHTDSHEDLIRVAGLRDDRVSMAAEAFCRVEFTPPDDFSGIADLSKWTLRVDECSAPSWYDSELVREKMERRVQAMIIDGERDILLGGCHILVCGANVRCVKNARIAVMLDSSRVDVMLDSSRVGEMLDSSRVDVMLDSSRVGVMRESSRVDVMRGSSRVGEMRDSSRVGVMRESSRVIMDKRC